MGTVTKMSEYIKNRNLSQYKEIKCIVKGCVNGDFDTDFCAENREYEIKQIRSSCLDDMTY